MDAFVARHEQEISGVLACFDRVVITGTLTAIAHAGAMAACLAHQGIRLFDYPRWAEPLREELRANAERLAGEAGIAVEYIRRHKAFRKEDRIQAMLAERGTQPGLVHVFSAMEPCSSFRPWHDKTTHRTQLKPERGRPRPRRPDAGVARPGRKCIAVL